MPPDMKASTTCIPVTLPSHLTHIYDISRHNTWSTSCPFVRVATPHVSIDGYPYSNDTKISLCFQPFSQFRLLKNVYHESMACRLAVKASVKISHAYKISYHLALLVHTDQHPNQSDMKINMNKLKNIHHTSWLICLTPNRHYVKEIIRTIFLFLTNWGCAIKFAVTPQSFLN